VKVIILDCTNVDCLKGGHPTAAAIQNAGTCTGPTGHSHLQATIVLGAPANKNGGACYYLLLARLYTLEIKVDQKVADALYVHLHSKLKWSGFQGHQFGGSGGRAEIVNKNLLDFIRIPGNFPRKGKDIKFVCNGNVWNCLYMSSYQQACTVVKVPYSQPQR
jgi:hypothetical protein